MSTPLEDLVEGTTLFDLVNDPDLAALRGGALVVVKKRPPEPTWIDFVYSVLISTNIPGMEGLMELHTDLKIRNAWYSVTTAVTMILALPVPEEEEERLMHGIFSAVLREKDADLLRACALVIKKKFGRAEDVKRAFESEERGSYERGRFLTLLNAVEAVK